MRTALIAAVVSATVALLVEWAAKPSLEARKERILDRARADRAAVRAVARVNTAIGRLLVHVSRGGTGEEVWEVLRDDVSTELRLCDERLQEAVMSSTLSLSDVTQDAFLQLASAVRAWVLMCSHGADRAALDAMATGVLDPLSDLADEASTLKRWQFRRARRIRQRLTAIECA